MNQQLIVYLLVLAKTFGIALGISILIQVVWFIAYLTKIKE